ncbi:uncharacterized protein LOC126816302 isoform X2 [Patella vulgata]|uniref:uncharacterized protein LOC126816302 isoform X2 n=1 Tax=Patella vulgata TaxID=6465 RepID=UPI00217F8974|nr:uncharacterized protein LOC126816302 isoform X2 [Patella vulgata]
MSSERSANQFISALVKNLQAVCHGHVDFDKNVKVVGHLYLTVDSNSEFNYIVNEKVSKSDESSTTFISKSFYATDPQQKTPKKNVDRPLPPPTPNVLGKTRYDISVDLTEENLRASMMGGSPYKQGVHRQGAQFSPFHKPVAKRRLPSQRHYSPNSKVQRLVDNPVNISTTPSSPIDIDSDITVTFATPEKSPSGESNIENRVPPIDPTGQTAVEKFDDFEVFKADGYEEGESANNSVNESLEETEEENDTQKNTETSPSKDIHNVDLSRVKHEIKNSEGDESLYGASSQSQRTGDDSITGESNDDEFFASLREQTVGLYPVGGVHINESNNSNQSYSLDIPNLSGVSGQVSAYVPVAGTSSDGLNNTAMAQVGRCKQRDLGKLDERLYNEILDIIQNKSKKSQGATAAYMRYYRHRHELRCIDGRLFFRNKEVIVDYLHETVIQQVYQKMEGSCGSKKLYKYISQYYSGISEATVIKFLRGELKQDLNKIV